MKNANAAAPIPPKADTKDKPSDEHPAHAHEAMPSDDPENSERLNFLECFIVYTFMLITIASIAAVILDMTNPRSFSVGR